MSVPTDVKDMGRRKMELRKRYVFDGEYAPQQADRGYYTFAVSPDGKTFFIQGGNNGGVRILAHFSGESLYFGYSLHQKTLVEANLDQKVVITSMLERAAAMAPEKKLVPMHQVPGFTREEGISRHNDGWYSRGDFALQLSPPVWAPEATAWDIREGVYVRFPDGTCRLVPRREYYFFDGVLGAIDQVELKTRQGDCLVFKTGNDTYCLDSVIIPGEKTALDRHVVEVVSVSDESSFELNEYLIKRDGSSLTAIIARGSGLLKLTHPEHEVVEVKLAGEELFIVLAPGRSRPFSRDRRVD